MVGLDSNVDVVLVRRRLTPEPQDTLHSFPDAIVLDFHTDRVLCVDQVFLAPGSAGLVNPVQKSSY